MQPSEQTIPSSFSELGLNEKLCDTIKDLGYEAPTPVQSRSIPVLVAGKDLIAQAQTGTGKTGAFALPLLNNVEPNTMGTKILVLTPTRELAIQVAEAFKSYARRFPNFHVAPIYGGQSMSTQIRQLEKKPLVIVGTPGRVMDHLKRKTLSLQSLNALVLDEADEMLSMGFQEDIQWIIEQSPKSRQTALFSATMPKAIREIAQKYLKKPEEVLVKTEATDVPLITEYHCVVAGMVPKIDALTRILEVSEFDGMLIFTRTKITTVELAEKLEARGYSTGALNGDMTQEARERTVNNFKKGRLEVLVATDVAARGLHVERISHVVNFDVPFDVETYTHRIGRTGRAGKTGTAIVFVAPREMGMLRTIERSTGRRIGRFQMPTPEDLANSRIDRFIDKVEAASQKTQKLPYMDLLETIVERTQLPIEQIASALCSMIHEESPIFVERSEMKEERSSERPRNNYERPRSEGSPREQRPGKFNKHLDRKPQREFSKPAGSRNEGPRVAEGNKKFASKKARKKFLKDASR